MRTRARITLAALALGAALAGGVAWATIPADTGLYTACKLKATGTIRLIDPSGPSSSLLSHCTTLESLITWNQKGLKGDAGAAGENGVPGAKGDAGTGFTWRGDFVDDGAYDAGDVVSFEGSAWITKVAIPRAGEPPSGSWQLLAAQGANGTNGTNGVDGAKGDKGEPGATGATGAQGPVGPPGSAGAGTLESMRVKAPFVGLGSDGFAFSEAECPAGWTLTGGGYRATGVVVEESFQGPRLLAEPANNTWIVAAATGFLGSGLFQAWATCVRIAP
jgi:collagen triple helix repeat protein